MQFTSISLKTNSLLRIKLINDKKLIQVLEKILTQYLQDSNPLNVSYHLKEILKEFGHKSYLKYKLDSGSYLILTKDSRKIQSYKRYYDSPFPLLGNLEVFSTTVGEWNNELKKYGLKTRSKANEHPTTLVGTKIHLCYYDTLNSKGNRYLRQQYKRLNLYRTSGNSLRYWRLSWELMHRSWNFRLASLNSWHSTWYKDLARYELSRLMKGLNKILNLDLVQTTLQNVWIESPRGKYRQLSIPPKSWRLYFHMLNFFISYIYSPHLSLNHYDGFIYQRGCKSFWENLLWSPLLSNYSNLMEVDLSSGFPNMSLKILRQALLHDGLIPPCYIHLILHHLKSKMNESTLFPTFESYVENKKTETDETVTEIYQWE